VLAGVNGAGKSSVAGALLRARGGVYFNPDEYARALRQKNPGLALAAANSAAWEKGYQGLLAAIRDDTDYNFETTLGAHSISAALKSAAAAGMEVTIWYVGLASVGLHIERVAARVSRGGHDIPLDKIRARYDSSRENLIGLLAAVKELQVFDNSQDASPAAGGRPEPRLLMHLREGVIVGPDDLSATPEWAKPIVAAAIKLGSS
jgi:predicted ABC-type ATPase